MPANDITIFRKASGVAVAEDTVSIPFNPDTAERSQNSGFYGIRGDSQVGTLILNRVTTRKIVFTFNDQALSQSARAKLNAFVQGQLPIAGGGQGWLGALWLRDEVYGVAAGEQTINQRIVHGNAFTEGGETRYYYEMPIIITGANLDANPRSTQSGDQYWRGSFTCTELPGTD